MVFDENGMIITNKYSLNENMKYPIKTENKIKKINIKNFDHLCELITDPYDLVELLRYNKVDSPKNDSVTDFCCWPDRIIKKKEGLCLDISILVYLFCIRNNLESAISLIRYYSLYDYTDIEIGHAIPLFKSNRNNRIYVANYFAPGYGGIYGPFDSYDDALQSMGYFFVILHNPIIRDGDKPIDPFPFEDPKAMFKLNFVYSFLTTKDYNSIINWEKDNRLIKYYEIGNEAKKDIREQLDKLQSIKTHDGTIRNNLLNKEYDFIRNFKAEHNIISMIYENDINIKFINITKDENKIKSYLKFTNKYKIK